MSLPFFRQWLVILQLPNPAFCCSDGCKADSEYQKANT